MPFASVDEFVAVEVEGTPLGERLSDDVVRAIIEDARIALRAFSSGDGALDAPIRGHIVVAHPL